MHSWRLNLQPMCSMRFKETRLRAAALAQLTTVSFLQLL